MRHGGGGEAGGKEGRDVAKMSVGSEKERREVCGAGGGGGGGGGSD